MKYRCFNPKAASYEKYGGRGITVCEGWRYDFLKFVDDLGVRPSTKYSIDRINNDGHYSCGDCPQCIREGWLFNCRWATAYIQNRNRRTNMTGIRYRPNGRYTVYVGTKSYGTYDTPEQAMDIRKKVLAGESIEVKRRQKIDKK
jgi:hypothetical protein